MVGVVGGKDLAAEPSEEEFRLGLRSGIILCNALNKIQPGAVSKVFVSVLILCSFVTFFFSFRVQDVHRFFVFR